MNILCLKIRARHSAGHVCDPTLCHQQRRRTVCFVTPHRRPSAPRSVGCPAKRRDCGVVFDTLNTFRKQMCPLGITDRHCALITIPLLITQAPTCFNTYVPSSGRVLYPCELLKVWNCCVIGMYRCTVNVGVHRMLWFCVSVQLSAYALSWTK
jgi:hypothetical protein